MATWRVGLGRPIPAHSVDDAVEITIMLAQVRGEHSFEQAFTRLVLAGVVVFLAIVVITICFEGPRRRARHHVR
jgi:hypothetical protein